MFNPNFLFDQKLGGIDIEAKILDAVELKHSPEIIVPNYAAYDNCGRFLGYNCDPAKGIDYNTYYDNLSIKQHCDLISFATIHSRIESVIKKNPNIVFPDLCTVDNIFIDANKNVSFIDYDGLQVGKHRSVSISTNLGNPKQYIFKPKYFNRQILFTKELDKKSLIMLYFTSVFNIDLNKVGTIDPFDGKPITLDDVFSILNLDDPDLCHKVWKLFQDNQPNEYLGNDMFRIADKYDLKVLRKVGDFYYKCLEKKK